MQSVKAGVVGTGSRVGTLAFYGVFHEEGVDTDLPLRSGKPRRRKGGRAKRNLKLPRRPFLQASLDAAKEKMVDVFAEVSSAQIGPVELLRG
jgi:phage gpG-like protein